MTGPRFRPEPAPAGLTTYTVEHAGRAIGTVTRRRGGWWRAVAPDGRGAGSWHGTRREAAASLARLAERR